MNARKRDCYDAPSTEAELKGAAYGYGPPGISRADLARELGVAPDETDDVFDFERRHGLPPGWIRKHRKGRVEP